MDPTEQERTKMADVYSIYNYYTRRTDIATDDKVAFIKKFQNQFKRGRRVAKYMILKQNGKTYYQVFIQ